jgi:hypothetical protein
LIVQCISFGSHWWFRDTKDETTGALILAKSAFYNTTAFKRGEKVRYQYEFRGHVRINANGVMFSEPSEILQACFQTPGVERFMDSGRLLLQRKMPGGVTPDAYLVALRSEREGEIDFKARWRTDGVRVISKSVRGKSHETMVVIPTGGRVITNLGEWEVVWRKNGSLLSLVA